MQTRELIEKKYGEEIYLLLFREMHKKLSYSDHVKLLTKLNPKVSLEDNVDILVKIRLGKYSHAEVLVTEYEDTKNLWYCEALDVELSLITLRGETWLN